jgi:Zn-dependent protease with chaperone function
MPKYFPDEQFIHDRAVKFVPTMEAMARARPERFRFLSAFHIVLGYASYLSAAGVALLLSLLAIIAALASRLFWLLGAALGSLASGIALLQSLHVELPPPKGIPVERDEAPRLHEIVTRLAAETGAPKIGAILLITEPNAGVTSRYVNGLFGRTTTTLSLGLPLLQLLSPAEFRAVLCHEFAHTSGGHGHSSIWIARVWESWSQLPLIEQELGFAARLVLPPIYRWFMPKLGAYSAVLSRAHEFEADQEALRRGAELKPELTLIRIGIASQFTVKRFWPEIWNGAQTMPRTPREVFSRFSEIAKSVSGADLRVWLNAELEYKSLPLASHPDLSTRLRAMGAAVDAEAWAITVEQHGLLPQATAAGEYLGSSLPQFEKALTEKWARGSFLNWEDAYRHFERTRKRVAELNALEEKEALTEDRLVERALCIWNLKGPAAAEPLLVSARGAFPESAEVAFSLGRSLLQQGKEEGILLMERAIGRAPSKLRYPGTVEICGYLNRHNHHEEAVAFYNRMAREDEQQQKMAQQRDNISPYDSVTSHGLDAAVIEQIRTRVSTLDWVIAAYFFRKPTPLSPDRPLYLLGVKHRKNFLIPAFRAGMTAFDQLLALDCYPLETRFLLLNGSQPTLEKKIRELPDSLLFKR